MSADQVTPNDFQKRVEKRLSAVLNDLRVQVNSRRIGKEKVPFLSGEAEPVIILNAQDLSVAIRQDSAGFTVSGESDYYEAQDYPNAEGLADALSAEITKRWRAHSRE